MIKPVANVVIDNPDADGRIEKHGFAYTWRFRPTSAFFELRELQGPRRFDPQWYFDRYAEIVPGLDGLTLAGNPDYMADMDIDEWSIKAGGTNSWREYRMQGPATANWLMWCESAPNRVGILQSNDDYEPNLVLLLYEYAPPPGQTLPIAVEVTLHGSTVAYTLQIPQAGGQYLNPRLWRATSSDNTIIWGCVPSYYSSGSSDYYDQVYISDGAGWYEGVMFTGDAYVNMSGSADGWYYIYYDGTGWKATPAGSTWPSDITVAKIYWTSAGGITAMYYLEASRSTLVDVYHGDWDTQSSSLRALSMYGVRFDVIGGSFVLRIAGLQPWIYRPESDSLLPQSGKISVCFRGHAGAFWLGQAEFSSAQAWPLTYINVPSWMNQGAPNYLAVGNAPTGTSVTVTDDAGAAGQHRPVINLTTTGTDTRPVVYMVHQYIEPEFSSPRSSPAESEGRGELVSLSWIRRWPRGWEFSAVLRDPDDYWLDNCRRNAKVTVSAGWDSASTQVGVFYLDEPVRRWRARDDTRMVEIRGRDIITARLAEKKYLGWHCSPIGWYVHEWIEFVLKCAGVPDSLISMPSSSPMITATCYAAEPFKFGHDTLALDAIDKVAAAYGYVLGVNTSGQVTLYEWPTTASAGDYDVYYADEENVVTEIEAVHQCDDWRNYVAIFLDDDRLDAYIDHDEDSHKTPTDEAFIGDDWWDVRVEEDATSTRSAELLQKRLKRWLEVRWSEQGRLYLAPGVTVTFDVPHMGIPTGATGFIFEDTGWLSANDIERKVSAWYNPEGY